MTVLKKYAEFSGRASRREYWMFFVINLGISVALSIVGTLIEFDFLDSIYSLAVLLPSVGVAIRRMHDIDKSGWFSIIPFYNLYLAAQEGTEGPNKYGAAPSHVASENSNAPKNS